MKTAKLWSAAVAVVILLGLAAGAAPAVASRALLTEALLHTGPGSPPPEGEVEGACGLAVAPGGPLYIADYYHRAVDLFSTQGDYQSQIALPGAGPVLGTNRLDAVCGLALDAGGRLYGNEWHQGARLLRPTEAAIDGDQSTGVAVDGAGNLYVADRTRIAEYAAPVSAGDPPVAEIGLGSLGDGYGVAVSTSGARVYAADAADQTVKVYEPPAVQPVQTLAGFESLRDAALAVDPTNEHLLVVDDAQPGFEHPISAIDEYSASGAFLGRLPGAPIHGEPSGLAVDLASGDLYVTSGNDEEANVFVYGPYESSGAAPGSFLDPQATSPTPPEATAITSAATQAVARGTPERRRTSASASEVFQRGGVRVKLDGDLTPSALPRHGTAGVHVSLATQIATADGGTPPQLRQVAIAINRNGRLDPTGLPRCRLAQIQPATTEGALAACRGSLVGEGFFTADVKLPEQSPFPSAGKVLAFNGVSHGRPVILAHVFGTNPVPTSLTLVFSIGAAKGTYGTILRASVPEATGDSGFVTGLRLNLGASFSHGGHRYSYISAGCPAPAGFPGASFSLARVSFAFAGGPNLTSVLVRDCKARR
jgi:DNA-binding beta-propeller fold protein YncE